MDGAEARAAQQAEVRRVSAVALAAAVAGPCSFLSTYLHFWQPPQRARALEAAAAQKAAAHEEELARVKARHEQELAALRAQHEAEARSLGEQRDQVVGSLQVSLVVSSMDGLSVRAKTDRTTTDHNRYGHNELF